MSAVQPVVQCTQFRMRMNCGHCLTTCGYAIRGGKPCKDIADVIEKNEATMIPLIADSKVSPAFSNAFADDVRRAAVYQESLKLKAGDPLRGAIPAKAVAAPKPPKSPPKSAPMSVVPSPLVDAVIKDPAYNAVDPEALALAASLMHDSSNEQDAAPESEDHEVEPETENQSAVAADVVPPADVVRAPAPAADAVVPAQPAPAPVSPPTGLAVPNTPPLFLLQPAIPLKATLVKEGLLIFVETRAGTGNFKPSDGELGKFVAIRAGGRRVLVVTQYIEEEPSDIGDVALEETKAGSGKFELVAASKGRPKVIRIVKYDEL